MFELNLPPKNALRCVILMWPSFTHKTVKNDRKARDLWVTIVYNPNQIQRN